MQLVEVSDNEICLYFQDGNFYVVLEVGCYVFWNSVIEYCFEYFQLEDLVSVQCLSRKLLINFLLFYYLLVFLVSNYECVLFFVDGEFREELGFGSYFYW